MVRVSTTTISNAAQIGQKHYNFKIELHEDMYCHYGQIILGKQHYNLKLNYRRTCIIIMDKSWVDTNVQLTFNIQSYRLCRLTLIAN